MSWCLGHLPCWGVWRDPVPRHWPYHDNLSVINLVGDHGLHAQLGAQTQSWCDLALHESLKLLYLTEDIDIEHSSPRLHGASPECLRSAQTRIVNADIDLELFFLSLEMSGAKIAPFQVQDGMWSRKTLTGYQLHWRGHTSAGKTYKRIFRRVAI